MRGGCHALADSLPLRQQSFQNIRLLVALNKPCITTCALSLYSRANYAARRSHKDHARQGRPCSCRTLTAKKFEFAPPRTEPTARISDDAMDEGQGNCARSRKAVGYNEPRAQRASAAVDAAKAMEQDLHVFLLADLNFGQPPKLPMREAVQSTLPEPVRAVARLLYGPGL